MYIYIYIYMHTYTHVYIYNHTSDPSDRGSTFSKLGCYIILRFFLRFLMMQHRKKSLSVYLSFVNKNVLQNNCVNKILDDWHCNSFSSVDIYHNCINYSCK